MRSKEINIDYSKWKGSKKNKLSYQEILSYPGKGKPPILCHGWQYCKDYSSVSFSQYNELMSIQYDRKQQRACVGWDKFILKNLNNITQHPFEYPDEKQKQKYLLQFNQPILTKNTIKELSTYEYSTDTEYDSEKDDEDYHDDNKKSAYEMRATELRVKSEFSPLL